jgi:hypothetical protein
VSDTGMKRDVLSSLVLRTVRRGWWIFLLGAGVTGIKVVTASPTGIQGVINIFNLEGRLQGLLAAADVDYALDSGWTGCYHFYAGGYGVRYRHEEGCVVIAQPESKA